jgi:prevent-host-death family protein
MAEISVRELKIHASKVMRAVREQRARYLITFRGRPVGVLLPLDERSRLEVRETLSNAAVWEELNKLGEEIARGWQSSLSSSELLSEMRR